jgi:putative SOS response-associated peptidase YedK
MIDRYSLGITAAQLQLHFGVDAHGFERPRYNAAPTQLLPVITSDSPGGLSHFYWGEAPRWAKNKSLSEKLINVATDQLTERASSKKKLLRTRCAVPADGFYVWKKVGKKITIPYRITLADQSPFCMAGLWEEYEDEQGETQHTFSIITTSAPPALHEVADRIPVVLLATARIDWLNKKHEEAELLACLKTDSVFTFYPVSPRIQDTSLDQQSLTLPTPPADQFGNLTLFN